MLEPPATPAANSTTVWTIGEPDGTSFELASGGRRDQTFVVGRSNPRRDFSATQEGSLDLDGKVLEHPRRIIFDLPEPPAPRYELALDLIFTAGAPRQLKVQVNEKTGIFPIRPVLKRSVWGEQGNQILLAKQRLIVPLDGAWLRAKANQITVVPLGFGNLEYDALSLHSARFAPGNDPDLEPTIFFRGKGARLAELCHAVVPFEKRFRNGKAEVSVGGQTFVSAFTNSYDFGVVFVPLELPAHIPAGRAKVAFDLDGQLFHAERDFKPAKRWKFFVCSKVHNDVGYTDLHPNVEELNNRNTDRMMEVLDAYPFYKFNLETAWLAEEYLRSRSGPYRTKFLANLRQGRLSVNAFYLNLLTGTCSGEELYRALYFAHQLHREEGGNFDYACLTDVPSHSWFLPTLLSDVGVKRFANGSNQTRAPILHNNNLNEDSPFWWEGMNGERILMEYARAYGHLEILTEGARVEGKSTVGLLERTLPQFLLRYLRDDYAPDAVMIYGTYEDNAVIPGTAEAKTVAAWNEAFEFPKLILATDAEYFEYIEKHFADKLPVHRGDCGAYWEDGVASTARITALHRQTQQLLPSAETAAALASMCDPRNRYPAEDFRAAWRNVLFYDEHTWGARRGAEQPGRDFVERQWKVKEGFATQANHAALNLLTRAHNRLSQQINLEGSSMVVFNWLNQERTAPVEVQIASQEQLVDLADGQPVSLDAFFERDGWRKVRFLAREVPAMGYKAYGIRRLSKGAPPQSEPIPGETIESAFYRLTIDRRTGAVRSLFDKSQNRELVDAQAPYKLNEYLYVSGGDGTKRNSLLLNCAFISTPTQLRVDTPSDAEIKECMKTPLGQRIVAVTRGKNTPSIRSEYLLYDSLKRVDIVNTIEKEEVRNMEAVYFAFPFVARHPAFEYQIQNGWVRPNADQMPGACREWFATQNLVHLRDGSFSVAWSTPDAPMITLQDINRGLWLSHLQVTNGHVYSYAMNNYWFTNYRGQQGGTFVFRYFITSGSGLTREDLARFDEDTRAPLLAHPHLASFTSAISQSGRPMSGSGGSFLSLDAPNLEIVTIKEAEDQDGFILRFREVAGRSGEAEVRLPLLRVRGAFLCNGVEENQSRLAFGDHEVMAPFRPNAFTTVRLKVEPAAVRGPR